MAVYYEEGVEDSPPIAIPPLSGSDNWIPLKFPRGEHALHTYTIDSTLTDGIEMKKSFRLHDNLEKNISLALSICTSSFGRNVDEICDHLDSLVNGIRSDETDIHRACSSLVGCMVRSSTEKWSLSGILELASGYSDASVSTCNAIFVLESYDKSHVYGLLMPNIEGCMCFVNMQDKYSFTESFFERHVELIYATMDNMKGIMGTALGMADATFAPSFVLDETIAECFEHNGRFRKEMNPTSSMQDDVVAGKNLPTEGQDDDIGVIQDLRKVIQEKEKQIRYLHMTVLTAVFLITAIWSSSMF